MLTEQARWTQADGWESRAPGRMGAADATGARLEPHDTTRVVTMIPER
jgi:hypothetical protein